MKGYFNILLLTILAFAACNKAPAPKPESAEESNFTQKGSIRTMRLEMMEPEFPEGEGKQVFISNCTICHTGRYISMQPNFPEKVWKAEVHKMIEKFGAPIPEDRAKQIVAYLVKIKGIDGGIK